MAYFPPRFNMWCRVAFEGIVPANLQLRGYSLCQLRGPASRESDPGFSQGFQVLFPMYSDVRGIEQRDAGLHDWLQLAGWGDRWAVVTSVCDKGAGFTNEYRQAECQFTTHGVTNMTPGMPAAKFGLEPPVGFVPLPLILPEDHWFVVP